MGALCTRGAAVPSRCKHFTDLHSTAHSHGHTHNPHVGALHRFAGHPAWRRERTAGAALPPDQRRVPTDASTARTPNARCSKRHARSRRFAVWTSSYHREPICGWGDSSDCGSQAAQGSTHITAAGRALRPLASANASVCACVLGRAVAAPAHATALLSTRRRAAGCNFSGSILAAPARKLSVVVHAHRA